MPGLNEGTIEPSGTREELRLFVSRVELKDIQVVKCSGELTDEPDGDEVEGFSAELIGQYRFVDSALQCKWSVEIPLHVGDGRNVANIELVLVETFDCPPEAREGTSSEIISDFLTYESLPIAMPYFREAVQSMGMKLGLGSVVLGLMHEPGRMPQTASIKRWPARKRRTPRQKKLAEA